MRQATRVRVAKLREDQSDEQTEQARVDARLRMATIQEKHLTGKLYVQNQYLFSWIFILTLR